MHQRIPMVTRTTRTKKARELRLLMDRAEKRDQMN